MVWLDGFILSILTPLAGAILFSGLDDLLVDIAWGCIWLKSKLQPEASLFPPGPRQLQAAPIAPIAIFVPLWHEDAVVAQMLEHNLGAIRYPEYHFFAGCYPNDAATQAAVRKVSDRFPNVHLAVCPHDGPTSKADCLNWVYQNMLVHEERTGVRFEIVVTHDAEDLIHPEELRWLNYYAARYDFVQTPVLALPTPVSEWTHGIYIDEFAEFHSRDMPVRAALGGFVPSCGVGTGWRRSALEKLAVSNSNRIFEPEALTEDYDNGLRVKRLGCEQAFVPIAPHGTTDFVATREYFPQNFRAALRQRVRWVMGISLQGWQKFGWRGTPTEIYWLWRDRKGLLANPLSIAANLVFVYGLLTGVWQRASDTAMVLAQWTFVLLLIRAAVRIGCVRRVYGWKTASAVPFRAVYANVLNAAATVEAIRRYTYARLTGQPLKWLKTAHAYPNRALLLNHKRPLGEILVAEGVLDATTLSRSLSSCPTELRIGEHLMQLGLLTSEQLYDALSFQQGLPLAHPHADDIRPEVARCLPAKVARNWQVLPFGIQEGELLIASPNAPSETVQSELKSFTNLEIRFHLMPSQEFEDLCAALL